MIVDCALYRHGRRVGGRLSVEDAAAHCREADSFVWIGMASSPPAEIRDALARFGLPVAAAERPARHRERSRLGIADHTIEMVMRTARYLDDVEEVEFGQVGVVVGERLVLVSRLGEVNDLRPPRARLEDDPAQLAHGPSAVLATIVGAVLDSYPRVLEGIGDDIEEVEERVFSDQRARDRTRRDRTDPASNPTKRIYDLNSELLELRRAIAPLVDAIAQLADETRGRLTPEQARWFRELADSAQRHMQSVESNSDLLTNALSANLTQVSLRQNEDMRKISAWAAILALPTMIAGIYGMNFEHMPELDHPLGYPVVLVLMAGVCLALYRKFKQVGWL